MNQHYTQIEQQASTGHFAFRPDLTICRSNGNNRENKSPDSRKRHKVIYL